MCNRCISSSAEKIGKVFPTVTPQVAGNISDERPSDWKEYHGETIKFYHPDEWQPKKKSLLVEQQLKI